MSSPHHIHTSPSVPPYLQGGSSNIIGAGGNATYGEAWLVEKLDLSGDRAIRYGDAVAFRSVRKGLYISDHGELSEERGEAQSFTITGNKGANGGDELNPGEDGFYHGFNLHSAAHPEGLRMKDIGNGAHGYGLIHEGGGNDWAFGKNP